jgi:hypothetical protein
VTSPIQVLREWVTVTERKYGRVRLTQTVSAEQAEAALAQVEALVEAALAAEDLWDKRMLGAAIVAPDRDDPDPLTQAAFALYAALDPFKDNQ